MRFIDDAVVTTLQTNPLFKFFLCVATRDHRLGQAPALIDALRAFAQIEHPSGEFQAQFTKIWWPTAV